MKKLTKFIILVPFLAILGCSTVKSDTLMTVQHKEDADIIAVKSHKSESISYKKGENGEIEVNYTSQAPSMLSKILAVLSLGILGEKE